MQRSYQDVIQLFGKSGRILCPIISPTGVKTLFDTEQGMRNDPRFKLYPQWIQDQVSGLKSPIPAVQAALSQGNGGNGKMVMDVMRAGGLVVAGTDHPNAFDLHGELMAYVTAGMTPYEALKTATVNSAKALGLDAGSIEAGKLADIVMVEGNPLENIANAHKVKRVIANGRLFDMDDLLKDTYKEETRPPQ